jgi:hypothetical protein
MRTRGRKKSVDTTVVQGKFGTKIAPVSGLSVRQKQIWNEIIADEPADFFATAATKRLLADYCRHVELAERLSKRIDELFEFEGDDNPLHGPKGVAFLENLTKVRDRELRAGNEKLTKLRLTNQSRYGARVAANAGDRAAKGGKPWDDD